MRTGILSLTVVLLIASGCAGLHKRMDRVELGLDDDGLHRKIGFYPNERIALDETREIYVYRMVNFGCQAGQAPGGGTSPANCFQPSECRIPMEQGRVAGAPQCISSSAANTVAWSWKPEGGRSPAGEAKCGPKPELPRGCLLLRCGDDGEWKQAC